MSAVPVGRACSVCGTPSFFQGDCSVCAWNARTELQKLLLDDPRSQSQLGGAGTVIVEYLIP